MIETIDEHIIQAVIDLAGANGLAVYQGPIRVATSYPYLRIDRLDGYGVDTQTTNTKTVLYLNLFHDGTNNQDILMPSVMRDIISQLRSFTQFGDFGVKNNKITRYSNSTHFDNDTNEDVGVISAEITFITFNT